MVGSQRYRLRPGIPTDQPAWPNRQQRRDDAAICGSVAKGGNKPFQKFGGGKVSGGAQLAGRLLYGGGKRRSCRAHHHGANRAPIKRNTG